MRVGDGKRIAAVVHRERRGDARGAQRLEALDAETVGRAEELRRWLHEAVTRGGYEGRLRGGYEGRLRGAAAVVTSGAHRQLQLVAELDGICVQVLEQRHEDRVLDLVDLDLREKGGEGRRRSEKVGEGWLGLKLQMEGKRRLPPTCGAAASRMPDSNMARK